MIFVHKKFVLIFAFLLFPFSFALAIVADVNFINELKRPRMNILEADCNYLEIQIGKVSSARIQKPKKSTDKSARPPRVNYTQLTFESRVDRDIAIKKLTSELNEKRSSLAMLNTNNLETLFPVFDFPFDVNKTGIFGGHQRLRIISIVDDKNAIVSFEVTERFQDSPGPRESKTLIGLRRGRYIPVEKTIYLRGVPTEGLVTGSYFTPKGLFMITGTEDYHTPDRAKITVFIFEPLELPPDFL